MSVESKFHKFIFEVAEESFKNEGEDPRRQESSDYEVGIEVEEKRVWGHIWGH